MKKADIKLEELLTVVGPSMIVRIMDETLTPTGMFINPDEITAFKGPAVKAFKEYAGKGHQVKHISPEVEKNENRYVLHIYIY